MGRRRGRLLRMRVGPGCLTSRSDAVPEGRLGAAVGLGKNERKGRLRKRGMGSREVSARGKVAAAMAAVEMRRGRRGRKAAGMDGAPRPSCKVQIDRGGGCRVVNYRIKRHAPWINSEDHSKAGPTARRCASHAVSILTISSAHPRPVVVGPVERPWHLGGRPGARKFARRLDWHVPGSGEGALQGSWQGFGCLVPQEGSATEVVLGECRPHLRMGSAWTRMAWSELESRLGTDPSRTKRCPLPLPFLGRLARSLAVSSLNGNLQYPYRTHPC